MREVQALSPGSHPYEAMEEVLEQLSPIERTVFETRTPYWKKQLDEIFQLDHA
jgi:hypothetical protein